jgi:hypothetical protein
MMSAGGGGGYAGSVARQQQQQAKRNVDENNKTTFEGREGGKSRCNAAAMVLKLKLLTLYVFKLTNAQPSKTLTRKRSCLRASEVLF